MGSDDQDFSKYIYEPTPTHKESLIGECQKHKISIYVDDPSETTSGAYEIMRTVASEAELENRLRTYKALSRSSTANIISAVALVVSIAALIKSFF